MSQKWEYNGVTLEVDLQDADFAASYEKAFARLEESEKEMQKVGMNRKKNARMCDEAYRNFLTAAKKDADDARNQRMSFMSRFTPHQNRQQRRHQGQGKGKQTRRNGML